MRCQDVAVASLVVVLALPTVEEHVYILESYLKTMSYPHCRQSFFEKSEGKRQ
jgi:hypothetical protein